MNTNDTDHSSLGNIPFSWENRPGVRKDGQDSLAGERWNVAVQDNSSTGEGWRVAVQDNSSAPEGRRKISLPPPPCENSNKAIYHDIGLPLPPCAFQPPLKSSSRRSKDDDPFLMAYKECTKSNKKGTLTRKNSFLGSCKYTCSVRDDSIVRLSHIPMSNSDGKRSEGVKLKHQG